MVQYKIEMLLSVLCCPRWPRQVQLCVTVAGVIVLTFANGNMTLVMTQNKSEFEGAFKALSY
jgi:hypothetical protein